MSLAAKERQRFRGVCRDDGEYESSASHSSFFVITHAWLHIYITSLLFLLMYCISPWFEIVGGLVRILRTEHLPRFATCK